MRNLTLLPFLLTLALAPAANAESARIIAMSDGDSGKILLGGVEVKFRQMALDTPETGSHAKCDAERAKGDAAKRYAWSLLPPGKVIDFRPKVGGKGDKYGRTLGWITVDGFDYAQHMIAKGYGVYYDGGRKQSFCP